MWEYVLVAVALVLMLEGLVALASPGLARSWLERMLQLSDQQLRFMGLIGVTLGVILLYLVRLLS